MSVDERRVAIVGATVPLLLEHGSGVTTGQIARAAGIAEGTVFRAFPDKPALLWACLQTVFDPTEAVGRLAAIAPGLPLRDRLDLAAEAMAEHWERAMAVGHAVRGAGCVHPPGERPGSPPVDRGEVVRVLHRALAELLRPDAGALRLPVERAAQLFLGLITSDRMGARVLGGTAPAPADRGELIDLFLHGALAKGEPNHDH
jgi:AcrR family transcriptional regulator